MSFEIEYKERKDGNSEERRCGEIFMNLERVLVFHCTLCEMKFNGFNEYAAHLDEHYPLTLSSFVEIQIKHEDSCDAETSFENDVLDEAEISLVEISAFSEKIGEEDDNINTETESISKPAERTQEDEKIEMNKCRPVRKKANYLQPPDEIRKFKCTICPATFKDASSLRKHVVRHTTEKSHQCPQCEKMFYTPIDVKKHLAVHSGERPFLCTICGRTCLSGFKLKDHMRRHTNQRDYKCSYCDKGFYNASLLTEHMQVHSNERRHKCTICEASFTYRKGLRNHIKLHENKRGYKCELCSATFNQQAGLFCHMKNKHRTV